MLGAEATMEADQLKLLARSFQPIDDAVADQISAGLQVFIEADNAPATIASVLEHAAPDTNARSMGPIQIACLSPELGEAVLDLPGRYPVTPQIRGALKSLPGVVTVEEL